MTSGNPPTRSSARHTLSPLLTGIAVGALAVGLVFGGVVYANRSQEAVAHVPGTEAWWPHLGLTVVAAGWLVLVTYRRRRIGRGLATLLTAPIGARAAGRLRRTARESTLRTVLATALVLLLVYSAWRVGGQVLAGLDPNFVADAWGGPSYLGAMYCHYLDAGLIVAVAAVLLDRLLLV